MTLLIATAQVILAVSPSSPQGTDLSDDESGVRKIRETGDHRICRVVSTVEVPHLSEEERRAEWGGFESDIRLYLLFFLGREEIPVGDGDPCEGGTLEVVTRIARDEELGYSYAAIILQYFAHKPTRDNLGVAEPAWVEASAEDPIR